MNFAARHAGANPLIEYEVEILVAVQQPAGVAALNDASRELVEAGGSFSSCLGGDAAPEGVNTSDDGRASTQRVGSTGGQAPVSNGNGHNAQEDQQVQPVNQPATQQQVQPVVDEAVQPVVGEAAQPAAGP
eukprot:137303_1